MSPESYDSLIKLCFNENSFGPPDSVIKAMTGAFKYANRYGYPDGGIVQAIADHHGVAAENILIGAGSTELLDVMAEAFVTDGKEVIGVEPTFDSVYSYATGLHGDAIKLPLLPDHRQDIPAMIKATKDNAANVAFVYLCNPNNPTGAIVTKTEIADLLNGIPENVPVLIDEAYHHFADDPAYGTSVPFVQQGRPVVVTRTFSKIAALAGMRLGYAVAPPAVIQKLRPHSVANFSVNAVVKWGGVAALKDTESMEKVRSSVIASRKKTTAELQDYGYSVIPSQGNFFMVNLRRPIGPVSQEIQPARHSGRPAIPAHDRVSACLHRHARGNGQVYGRLQGNPALRQARVTSNSDAIGVAGSDRSPLPHGERVGVRGYRVSQDGFRFSRPALTAQSPATSAAGLKMSPAAPDAFAVHLQRRRASGWSG